MFVDLWCSYSGSSVSFLGGVGDYSVPHRTSRLWGFQFQERRGTLKNASLEFNWVQHKERVDVSSSFYSLILFEQQVLCFYRAQELPPVYRPGGCKVAKLSLDGCPETSYSFDLISLRAPITV